MWWFVLILVIIILSLLVYWGVKVYNKLLVLRNDYRTSWANIDVKLKERFDLIPNLVEIVKSYSNYEKSTLESIINIRNQYVDSNDDYKKIEYNSALSKELKDLFALAESYPELKANTNFIKLQEQLHSIEDDISICRNEYNNRVLVFNNNYGTFPTVLIARLLGFSKAIFFEVSENEREVPIIRFK